jgi:ferric-dicitrate binding protein FerR (iron transport regulator)|tara:strand:+ start:366 stop:1985 length:1620 start_codon:yes stop_codon:yes gene_type:complete
MKHDWQEWIDRLGNNDVSEQELRDFQQAVQESPEHIDEYMDALLVDASLGMKDGLLVSHVSNESEASKAQTLLTTTAPNLPAAKTLTTSHQSSFTKVYLAVAACVALLVGLSYFLGKQSQPVAPDIEIATHVATITDSDKIADAAGLRIGKPLQAGEIIVPPDSEIGIAMRGGARLQINGPAKLRIDGPENVFLHSGRVQTYAPEYAHGFAIDTNEGEVVDLGTRFVTASGTDMGTEIHVLEGLVKARASENVKDMFYIGGEQAAILKNGKMLDTEFLARRLNIPINPNLADSDGDRVVDLIEAHYGTNAGDPNSTPDLLRIAEPFVGYDSAKMDRTSYRGTGKISQWTGNGTFQDQGLVYRNNGKTLLTTGGCLATTGEKGVGAAIVLDDKELPKDGVIYISFLMQQPKKELNRPFSGLLLYLGEYREQLFTGELSVTDSYGARYAESDDEDIFAIPTDDQPHLFVLRIDKTRFLTDVFVDPPLGQIEKGLQPERRYQNAPKFDRIMLRSGSDSGTFSVRFDEVRIGLTWDAVLPLKP